MNRQRSRVGLLLLGLIIVVAACDRSPRATSPSTAASSPSQAPAAAATVRIVTSKNAWCGLVLIANEKRYFDDEGVKADISYQDAGRFCLDSLVAGSADMATIVEVNIAYIAFSTTTDVTTLSGLVESSSFGTVARKSSGVEKLGDLRGKRVAFSSGTGGEPYAYRFLERAGLKPNDIQLRKLQPKALQGALVAKEVDAICTWDPWVETSRKVLGDDAIVFVDPEAYTGYILLAAHRAWAEQHPREADAVLKALKRAEEYVRSNPAEARAVIAKATSIPPDILEAQWNQYKFAVTTDLTKQQRAVEMVGEFIKSTNPDFAGKSLPDYRSYFEPIKR